jgi:cytochrome P450
VPAALLGTAAGALFGRFIRMTDGVRREPVRRAVAAGLAGLDPAAVAAIARRCAAALADTLRLGPGALAEFVFALPARAVATILGVPAERLDETAAATAALAAAFAPGALPPAIAAGAAAADLLTALMRELLASGAPDGLVMRLAGEAWRAGAADDDVVVANGVGLLFQSHDATAGLIGNTLVTLGRNAALRARVAAEPALFDDCVREVMRYDPPVHATRRFLAVDADIGGQAMAAGDAVLVLLAAAGRDPAANSDPARFLLDRPDRRCFTFGRAGHACPGEVFAVAIASSGVGELLRRGVDPAAVARNVAYRPSSVLRVPRLDPVAL